VNFLQRTRLAFAPNQSAQAVCGMIGLVTNTQDPASSLLKCRPLILGAAAAGGLPLHEPGPLESGSRNAAAGRLQVTTDAVAAINHGTLPPIAVGTTSDEDDSADLRHVPAAARNSGRYMTDYKRVIDKSAVPVGTADQVTAVAAAEFVAREVAVEDFMRPDRFVVGADDERAMLQTRAHYAPCIRNHDRSLEMDTRGAESTNYAAKCMLAMRTRCVNEVALLTEKVGADIEVVRNNGIGSDPRAGYQPLCVGTAQDDACFRKYVKALMHTGAINGIDLRCCGLWKPSRGGRSWC